MIKKAKKKAHVLLRRLNERIDYIKNWYRVPSLKSRKSIDLGGYGGSNVLVEDLNLDGREELIILQTAGMFKSKYYDSVAEVKNYKNKANQEEVFSLSCLKMDGSPVWTIGEPWRGSIPYLCHGHEQIIKLADLNGDGYKEILTFDAGDNLLVINFKGEILETIQLPNDSFSIVYHVPVPNNDFILVVGTMDRAYDPHPYANPWLILNSSFEIISNRDYVGAGHNIVVDDVNGDGVPELMIGYQLVDIQGNVIWTLDCWQDKEIDSVEQHADNIESFWKDGEWFAAISGSDKQYLINAKGETVWMKTLPHPQYSLVGQYKDELRVFVANQREIMNSFSFEGVERWSGLLPEFWLNGKKPKLLDVFRPIHQTIPLVRVEINGLERIIYLEGGNPYIIDFDGKIIAKMDAKFSSWKLINSCLHRRINNIGLSFQIYQTRTNIYAYDRRKVFEFKF